MTFDQLLLAQIIPEVRRALPDVRLRDAWVYHFHGDHWEFHYQDFYWHGSAGSAYAARAKGWAAFLEGMRIRSSGARASAISSMVPRPIRRALSWSRPNDSPIQSPVPDAAGALR